MGPRSIMITHVHVTYTRKWVHVNVLEATGIKYLDNKVSKSVGYKLYYRYAPCNIEILNGSTICDESMMGTNSSLVTRQTPDQVKEMEKKKPSLDYCGAEK